MPHKTTYFVLCTLVKEVIIFVLNSSKSFWFNLYGALEGRVEPKYTIFILWSTFLQRRKDKQIVHHNVQNFIKWIKNIFGNLTNHLWFNFFP
jgi:hypothetical protein